MSEAIPSSNTPSIRVLKIATCPTNSRRATLAYQIGCNAENEIFFRVTANTGGGLFSPEWVSLKAMLAILEVAHKPLASFPLFDLLKGRSINTPAFLMAALKSEGIVRGLVGKVRGYEIADHAPFMTEMQTLIASDVNLKVKDIPSDYKTSITLNKPKKAPPELTPKEIKREQRKIKSLLAKQ